MDKKGIITGHFITHWGVPSDIRPRKLNGVKEFAVIEFAPTGGRKTWRYATNGMSNYAQYHHDPSVNVQTELYATTARKVTWMDDFLAALTTYPIDYATFFAEGDTISVGQPIDQKSSCYSNILIAPPGPHDAAELGLIGGLEDETILVHQVIGLLDVEVQYAKRHGGKILWQNYLISRACPLDEERTSVLGIS